MPNSQLVEYIKRALAVGQHEDRIKADLLKTGWPTRDIEEALSVAKPAANITANIPQESMILHNNATTPSSNNEKLPVILRILRMLLLLGGAFSVFWIITGPFFLIFGPGGGLAAFRDPVVLPGFLRILALATYFLLNAWGLGNKKRWVLVTFLIPSLAFLFLRIVIEGVGVASGFGLLLLVLPWLPLFIYRKNFVGKHINTAAIALSILVIGLLIGASVMDSRQKILERGGQNFERPESKRIYKSQLLNGIGFKVTLPDGWTHEENPDGVAIVLFYPSGLTALEGVGSKVYRKQTHSRTFEDFQKEIKKKDAGLGSINYGIANRGGFQTILGNGYPGIVDDSSILYAFTDAGWYLEFVDPPFDLNSLQKITQ